MTKARGDGREPSAEPAMQGGDGAERSRKSVSLAKTMRPGLLAVVQRERLFGRIDQGAERGGIWVAGPPGAGKTTLVSSYLEHRRLNHLWYQVDRGDVDAATFFHFMGLAAERSTSLDRRTLPAFPSSRGGDVATFSQHYFRELYQRLTPPFVLVFDNYQEAPLHSPLSLIVNIALEEIARRSAVIVISRSEPPRELARMRANQRIELIGWSDLRLSPKELQNMARKRGQALDDAACQSLFQRTQGWAAGAVLMLEHAKVTGTEAEPPSDNTPQVVFDYVAGEIFDKFEDTSQKFLLSTACLSQMTPDMAEKISGYSKAGPLLANLARNDYFVTEQIIDGERVYQFHRLLCAFLRSRAKQIYSVDEWANLVRRSGWLLAEVGQTDDAIALLVDEAQWHDATKLMITNAPETLAQGRAETLTGWLDELPSSIATTDPWVLYWQGASRQTTAPRESRRYYERSYEIFRSNPNPNVEGMVLACCGITCTVVHELDDLSVLDPWIDILVKLWSEYRDSLAGHVEYQVVRSVLIALLLRRPGTDACQSWLETALSLCRRNPRQSLQNALTPVTALSLIWQGHYTQATDLINAARSSVAIEACSRDALAQLNYAESAKQLITGSLIGSTELNADSRTLDGGKEPWNTNRPQIHRAIAHLNASELDEAQALLQKISTDTASMSRLARGLVRYLQAWMSMWRGDRLGALQQIQSALGIATEVGSPALEMLCRLAWADTLASCGEFRKAENQVRRAENAVRSFRNPLFELVANLTKASVALDGDRRALAVESLNEALSIGRRCGFTQSPWWRPEAMAALCAVALAEDIEVDYVRHQIRTHDLAPVDSAMDLQSWPWPYQVFTLGKFRLAMEGSTQNGISKGARRPIELLKVLIALGGRDVRVEHLTDILWPNLDGDYAYGSFTSTLHRLRRLLERDDAVTLQDGRLGLNPRYFWVDTWVIERLFAAADRNAITWLSFASMTATVELILGLYNGAFLEDDSKFTCYIALREHLRGKMLRLLTKIARHAKDSAHAEVVSSFFERTIDADPLCEGFYRNLMVLYESLDRCSEALDVYNRCHTALTSILRTPPSTETIALYERLSHMNSVN